MTPTPTVVAAAQAAQRATQDALLPSGIPASISIAQFGQESGWGAHMPPGSNNPFGIKAGPGQPSVSVRTHEWDGQRFVAIMAPFRAFASLGEAFLAHAQLLAGSSRYARARHYLPDPLKFAQALTGLYATDPHYGPELIAIIVGDKLAQYDLPPL